MDSKQIRQKFLEFFKSRGHAIVPSSSLIPDDPSVLLTTAGMQQFKRYFTGELDPINDFGSKNTASIQKSFRTSDIDEVGDESHLTFFEMLGNFSFGGYFKKEAIQYAYEFIAKDMGLTIDYVGIFEGDGEIPADSESEKVWKSLGVLNIKKLGREDNFWGPTGSEGPCGPTTEIYVKNAAGHSIEIWNIVFNEYYCRSDKRLEKLKTPGVDTGMGLERLAMVSQNAPTIFETDLFAPIIGLLRKSLSPRTKRVIVDHLRGIVFLVSDGILPSNKDAGYIVRRLLRRAIEQVMIHEVLSHKDAGGVVRRMNILVDEIIKIYKTTYPNLPDNHEKVKSVISDEAKKFMKALSEGIKMLEKKVIGKPAINVSDITITGEEAFDLYQNYGLTIDILKDLTKDRGFLLDEKGFEERFGKHKEISRAGAEKKFGGHGLILDTGELKAGNEEELNKVLRLHTATHLLQQALREVLGPEVRQMGSDITPERTRFDFSFNRKLTPEEIARAEELVNQKIKEDLPVQFVELPKEEAEKTGALYFFKEKYPEKVKVYFVGRDLKSAWSKEFCGGPHVENTARIKGFKIVKEEAVGAGTRRIRGALTE